MKEPYYMYLALLLALCEVEDILRLQEQVRKELSI